MTTLNDIYDKANAALRTKCNMGICDRKLFRRMTTYASYPLDRILWMKEFIGSSNQPLATACIECLVEHGYDMMESREILENRFQDRIFSNRVIDLAEKHSRPDILFLYSDEKLGYVNRVSLAFKNTGNDSYLTQYLLSDDESLVKAMMRMTKD